MNNSGSISDERLEELLFQVRPKEKDAPLHPVPDDLTRRRIVGAVLAEWEDSGGYSLPRRARFRPSFVWAAVSVAGLLTGILLFAGTHQSATPSMTRPEVAQSSASSSIAQLVPQSRFSLLHGDVHCGDTAVKLGGAVPLSEWIETGKGQSAFSLPTGIAVGLSDNSSARVFWDGHRFFEVELNQGMALFSVDPHKARDGFYVRTPEGRIKVTGTLFTVVVADEGEVDVHLHRGKVEIQTRQNAVQYVKAGQTARLKTGAVSIDELNNNAEVANQLFKLGCIDAGQTFSELSSIDCDVNNPAAVAKGIAPARQTFHGGNAGGENRVRSDSLEALLQEGQAARRSRKWAQAAAVYRKIVREYPSSADGRTALVTLAELELGKLNDPIAARGHFAAYLKNPGALEPEALYGKAKTYRQTNDSDRELKTLKQLLDKYPSGPIAKAAGMRLNQLENM